MPQSTATTANSHHARADIPETMRGMTAGRGRRGQSDPLQRCQASLMAPEPS